MKTLALILTTVMLAACNMTGLQTQTVNSWDSQLKRFEGKSFDEAKAEIGRPESQYEKGDTKTYIWRMRTPDGQNATRNTDDWRPARTSNSVVTTKGNYLTCTIKADTVNNTVTRIWSEGTAGGCAYIENPRNNVTAITGMKP